MIRMSLAAAVILLLPAGASAQTAQKTAPPAAKPTLAQLGLIVYPAKGQSKDQQAKDESECYAWAEQQTGLSMSSAPVDVEAAGAAARGQAAEQTEGAAVVGAAGGAAGGAVIGAIAGDAGTGAAIGAVAGAMRGRRAKKQAEAHAEQQGEQQAIAMNQQAVGQFKKAASVCLQGRGYTAQ